MCDIGGRGVNFFLICLTSFMNARRKLVTHVMPRHKGDTEWMVPEVFFCKICKIFANLNLIYVFLISGGKHFKVQQFST